MDIRPIPEAQRHGLALVSEGEFVVAADTWTLAVSLDLGSFRKTVNRLEVNARTMRALARNFTEIAAKPTGAMQEYADAISSLLDTEVSSVQDELTAASKNLRMLEGATSTRPTVLPVSPPPLDRVKRAWIPIGGEVLKTVFGTASQRDIGRLQGQLSNLNVARREMAHILESQATLLNSSFQEQGAMSKQLDRLAQANKLLVTEVVQLQNASRDNTALLDHQPAINVLEARLRIIHAALSRLRAELTRFLVGWQAAAQHVLSPSLVASTDFLYALREIQARLSGGRQLLHPAIEDNLGALYSTSRVTVLKIPDGMLLLIDLPITQPGLTFRLHRALPLPVATASPHIYAHIIPDFPYFAVSLDQKLYVQMDMQDVSKCTGGAPRICNPQHPLKNAADGATVDCVLFLYRAEAERASRSCQVGLTKDPSPSFYRAAATTTWIYSVSEPQTITAHCHTDPALTPLPSRLVGQGTLTLPPGCSATVNGACLNAPAHFASAFQGDVQPFSFPEFNEATLRNFTLPLEPGLDPNIISRVDSLLNTTFGADPIASLGSAIRLDDLRRRITTFKDEAQQATDRTIHVATTATTSSVVFVAAAALIAYYCCCRGLIPCCPGSSWSPVPSTPYSSQPTRIVYAPVPPTAAGQQQQQTSFTIPM